MLASPPPQSPSIAPARACAVGAALLAFTALIATAGRASEPEPPTSLLRIAALQLSDRDADARGAIESLAAEARMRSSIETVRRAGRVDLSSDALFAYPVLVWSPTTAPKGPSEVELARLREHLAQGGMLWIDDGSLSGPSSEVDAAVRDIVQRLFGTPLQPIEARDVLYRTFYRLAAPVGRRADVRALEGIKVGRRWAIVYGRDDALGAYRRSASGGPAAPAVPGGESQRENAFRLGINVLMYAVCLDYKDDHSHVQTLLRSRRGSGTSGSHGR